MFRWFCATDGWVTFCWLNDYYWLLRPSGPTATSWWLFCRFYVLLAAAAPGCYLLLLAWLLLSLGFRKAWMWNSMFGSWLRCGSSNIRESNKFATCAISPGACMIGTWSIILKGFWSNGMSSELAFYWFALFIWLLLGWLSCRLVSPFAIGWSVILFKLLFYTG